MRIKPTILIQSFVKDPSDKEHHQTRHSMLDHRVVLQSLNNPKQRYVNRDRMHQNDRGSLNMFWQLHDEPKVYNQDWIK